jgi:hypothetical protein
VTHQLRERGEVEAWFHDGRPFDECPDWVKSHFYGRPIGHHKGRYALRDEEGYFWRWIDAKLFNERYQRITP